MAHESEQTNIFTIHGGADAHNDLSCILQMLDRVENKTASRLQGAKRAPGSQCYLSLTSVSGVSDTIHGQFLELHVLTHAFWIDSLRNLT